MDQQQMALISLLFGGGMGMPQGKDVNSMKSLVDFLMSPDLGVITGSYDPYLTLDEEGPMSMEEAMPITSSYLGKTGTMGLIANGLWSGQMDYTEALAEAKRMSGEENSDIKGLDLTDEIGRMRNEIAAYNASGGQRSGGGRRKMDDPYSKAGYPTPDRQWSIENMPESAFLQQMRAAEKKPVFARPRTKQQGGGRVGSPSAAAAATRPQLEKVGGPSVADVRAMGELAGLQASGRTPFTDAFGERVQMLSMLRQLGVL